MCMLKARTNSKDEEFNHLIPNKRILSPKESAAMSEKNRFEISQRNTRNSPFLRLPGELRNKIYNAYFGDMKWRIGSTGHAIHPPKKITSLLFVCRDIHTETAAIPYTFATFTFINTFSIYGFFRNIGKEQCAMIRSVELTYQVYVQFNRHVGLADDDWNNTLPKFRRIHNIEGIKVEISRLGHPDVWKGENAYDLDVEIRLIAEKSTQPLKEMHPDADFRIDLDDEARNTESKPMN